jgi:hypothetical protein
LNRRQGQTAKRTRTVDSDHSDKQSSRYDRHGERNRSPLKKFIPLLLIATVALLIAREEVPAVAEWWQKTFSPDSWTAQNICKQAVIDRSGRGRYVRVLKAGEVHDTLDGPYVDGLLVVELAADGSEQRAEYSCYLDEAGKLFKLHRKSPRD